MLSKNRFEPHDSFNFIITVKSLKDFGVYYSVLFPRVTFPELTL